MLLLSKKSKFIRKRVQYNRGTFILKVLYNKSLLYLLSRDAPSKVPQVKVVQATTHSEKVGTDVSLQRLELHLRFRNILQRLEQKSKDH